MNYKTQRSGKATKTISTIILLVIAGCLIYLGQFGITSVKKTNRDKADNEAYFKIEAVSPAASELLTPTESDPGISKPAQYDKPDISVDFPALRERSQNVCAWIYIPALPKVSCPVVYSGDDEYYLDHSWDGKNSDYCAIFIEAQNKNDLSDAHTIIYGHDMIDGSMFASIKKFKDKEFYTSESNKIYIITEKNTIVYEIFSLETVDPTDRGVYTVGFIKNDEYKAFLQDMKARCAFDTGVDVAGDENVITLSTCSGNSKRFVLHAKQCGIF